MKEKASGRLFVVGIGPYDEKFMSSYALDVIRLAHIICGYKTYIDRIIHFVDRNIQQVFVYNMGQEIDRVSDAIKFAVSGNNVALVSGGDSSLYGLASLVYELSPDYLSVDIVPGITAALAASARLGAVISEDTVFLSLSDLLIPWEVLKERIDRLANVDIVAAIYNPKSKSRIHQLEYLISTYYKARGPLLAGAVKNACSPKESIKIFQLPTIDYSFIDMSTILIIGSTKTYKKNDKLVTPRGYKL